MAKNLSQATAAALDSLGTSKTDFVPENKLDAIEKACGAFIQRVQNNLKEKDMIVTGEIADITLQQTDEGGVEILANPSLVYQDSGVSGTEVKYDTAYSYKNKKPPASAFIDWADRRGINTRNNEKYSRKKPTFKPSNPDSIGYAIANAVYKHGIKPKEVYSKEIDQLGNDVADAAGNWVVSLITRN
jgi:hypothetical protein